MKPFFNVICQVSFVMKGILKNFFFFKSVRGLGLAKYKIFISDKRIGENFQKGEVMGLTQSKKFLSEKKTFLEKWTLSKERGGGTLILSL